MKKLLLVLLLSLFNIFLILGSAGAAPNLYPDGLGSQPLYPPSERMLVFDGEAETYQDVLIINDAELGGFAFPDNASVVEYHVSVRDVKAGNLLFQREPIPANTPWITKNVLMKLGVRLETPYKMAVMSQYGGGNESKAIIIYFKITQASASPIPKAIPPSVSITSPSHGARFMVGDPVSITINAYDHHHGVIDIPDHVVRWYAFQGENKRTETVVFERPGQYEIKARVSNSPIENDPNALIDEDSITIFIDVPQVAQPTVSITSPSHGAHFMVGDPVSITINAYDHHHGVIDIPDHAVRWYAFQGENKRTETVVFDRPGQYEIKAKVSSSPIENDLGALTDEDSITIFVDMLQVDEPQAVQPTVSITSPLHGTHFMVGGPVSITVTAYGHHHGVIDIPDHAVRWYAFQGENQRTETVVFDRPGQYEIKAKVSNSPEENDLEALIDEKTITIFVDSTQVDVSQAIQPSVSIASPLNGMRFMVGEPVNITINAYGHHHGVINIPDHAVKWYDFQGENQRTETVVFDHPGQYEIKAKVSNSPEENDIEALIDEKTITIFVDSTQVDVSQAIQPSVSIASPPNGMRFMVGDPVSITINAYGHHHGVINIPDHAVKWYAFQGENQRTETVVFDRPGQYEIKAKVSNSPEENNLDALTDEKTITIYIDDNTGGIPGAMLDDLPSIYFIYPDKNTRINVDTEMKIIVGGVNLSACGLRVTDPDGKNIVYDGFENTVLFNKAGRYQLFAGGITTSDRLSPEYKELQTPIIFIDVIDNNSIIKIETPRDNDIVLSTDTVYINVNVSNNLYSILEIKYPNGNIEYLPPPEWDSGFYHMDKYLINRIFPQEGNYTLQVYGFTGDKTRNIDYAFCKSNTVSFQVGTCVNGHLLETNIRYESLHPHKEFLRCRNCSYAEYTGTFRTGSGSASTEINIGNCCLCGNHNMQEDGAENASPYRQILKCSSCDKIEYGAETERIEVMVQENDFFYDTSAFVMNLGSHTNRINAEPWLGIKKLYGVINNDMSKMDANELLLKHPIQTTSAVITHIAFGWLTDAPLHLIEQNVNEYYEKAAMLTLYALAETIRPDNEIMEKLEGLLEFKHTWRSVKMLSSTAKLVETLAKPPSDTTSLLSITGFGGKGLLSASVENVLNSIKLDIGTINKLFWDPEMDIDDLVELISKIVDIQIERLYTDAILRGFSESLNSIIIIDAGEAQTYYHRILGNVLSSVKNETSTNRIYRDIWTISVDVLDMSTPFVADLFKIAKEDSKYAFKNFIMEFGGDFLIKIWLPAKVSKNLWKWVADIGNLIQDDVAYAARAYLLMYDIAIRTSLNLDEAIRELPIHATKNQIDNFCLNVDEYFNCMLSLNSLAWNYTNARVKTNLQELVYGQGGKNTDVITVTSDIATGITFYRVKVMNARIEMLRYWMDVPGGGSRGDF